MTTTQHVFQYALRLDLQHPSSIIDVLEAGEGQMTEALKVRENRMRRMADRQGLMLKKSKSRDPNAMDYGLFALVDPETNGTINVPLMNRWACSWDLTAVEDYLSESRDERARQSLKK